MLLRPFLNIDLVDVYLEAAAAIGSPPRPAGQERIVAANRSGEIGAPA